MLTDKLNKLLANYVIEAHKLQTYHWYVKGHAFFQAHAKLEEYYDEAFAMVDEIAEKILMVGGTPLATVADFLSEATISEASATFEGPRAIFASVKDDFETLLAQVADIKTQADDEQNYLVSAFADEIIGSLSKHVWMLGQSQD